MDVLLNPKMANPLQTQRMSYENYFTLGGCQNASLNLSLKAIKLNGNILSMSIDKKDVYTFI